jgi:fructokinase
MVYMGTRKIYGFGETVLDIIFREGQPVAARPGGSVLNAFISLGRLGWDPRFISEYGCDDVGGLIDSYLIDNGVDTTYVNRFSDGKSALALAFLNSEGNASYSFYKDFPKERLQVLPDDLNRESIILFGSIYASSPEVRDSVLKFLEMGRERGALIVYDPNFRQAHLPALAEMKPMIIENIEFADIIRGSDEDFSLIFGIEDPEKLRDRIDTGSKILIYTRNAEGVRVIHKSSRLSVPAQKIVPVSTIGAGDNFNAGIVHFLLRNGIRREDLDTISEEEMTMMAETGVLLSTHVCLHYDNYISRKFADELRTG